MAKKLHLVLVALSLDGIDLQPTQILNIDTKLAAPYVKDGALDAAPEAVAHYRSNGSAVIEHVSAEEQAEAERVARAAAAAAATAAEIADLEAKLAAAADAEKPAIQATLDAKRAEQVA